jgi:hypothetical protein
MAKMIVLARGKGQAPRKEVIATALICGGSEHSPTSNQHFLNINIL